MITKLNVASIMVLNKDQALDFYVNKVGLEKGQDIKQGSYRWLTVRVPDDPGTEISLEEPGPPVHDEATAAQLRELITKGALGGLVFQSDDVRGLYETLKARGVSDFTRSPLTASTAPTWASATPSATPSGSSSRKRSPTRRRRRSWHYGRDETCNEGHAEVREEHQRKPTGGHGIHGRGKGRHEGARPRAAVGGAPPPAHGQGGRGRRHAREDRRHEGTRSRHGRAAPCDRQSQRASPFAETLVRDARVCQGRQGRLFLPKRAEVQHEVRDVRLQRLCEPRRRRPLAGRLRPEEVDCRRRGYDRRAREESGQLRTTFGFGFLSGERALFELSN